MTLNTVINYLNMVLNAYFIHSAYINCIKEISHCCNPAFTHFDFYTLSTLSAPVIKRMTREITGECI